MAAKPFRVVEATIADIHAAYRDGALTARQLVQAYLDRIEAYDKKGPGINSVISLNPKALEEADRLDAAMRSSALVGPMHGIPILMKDQGDVAGMPTTLGSVLFKDYMPKADAFAVAKLRKAGAIFLGKVTLGELGGGDTHGSLFGSTRNVYDHERTAGGSSGGSGAAVSANFCTVAVGQEGFSSIRRPAIWNGVVGMRPTIGLVSRGGVYGGWPTVNGSLGPMARTVTDLAKLLDGMVGYDPNDPVTAYGIGRTADSYSAGLKPDALKGARLGILRQSMGYDSEPGSEDFAKVTAVFDRAVADLRKAGADVIDPIVIPDLNALLDLRARDVAADDRMFELYFAGGQAPFATREAAMASPLFAKVSKSANRRWTNADTPAQHHAYMKARETLMINLLQVMADHRLDAIVHKAVEHQPTLIKDGVNPPFVDQKGAPHINTYLMFVPSIVVPAGFTRDNLPAGITFLGRPYDDAKMIELAYGYEQATQHRKAPPSMP
ncbi:amidase family protein [Rhodoplanes sp. Z2-YC6860]|uniref:amidase family protein n=1 Tax=Rhodoplanes sp. Z2-YC6860 TaxID=674703 RepID=UPI00078BF032|nr:amidase family protein [Rhodoplanes sp. Z2-YC6860]AMN41518.1 Amidase [Rhodoplanes sp. Z2-YC6860]